MLVRELPKPALVLAVVTERYRVPLMWTFLSHSGNSTTQQRIALMERYLALFNASTAVSANRVGSLFVLTCQ